MLYLRLRELRDQQSSVLNLPNVMNLAMEAKNGKANWTSRTLPPGLPPFARRDCEIRLPSVPP